MKRIKLISKLTVKQTAFFVILLIIFISASCAGNLFRENERLDPEVSKLLQAPSSTESYPDAEVIYFLDESIQEVLIDGRSTETVHMVFEIVRESGKDYADCEIGYNSRTETVSLLYARTITPAGKIIPLKENAVKVVTPYSRFPSYSDYKELTFSMPGVEVGCVIDYKYVIGKRPAIKGEFNSYFFFQTYNPVLLSRYKIIAPEDMDIKYLLLNNFKERQRHPDIINREGKKIYLWEQRDLPQILGEDYMPPVEEIAFSVLVTTMDSWENFFTWWWKEVKGKTESDDAIREKVADLTGNLSIPREKIEALFDYVKREVRYVSIDLGKSGYVPESAREVFENKYGDCKDQSTLLISMLRAAGIPAHYVLIPTHEVGNLIKDFPYPFQFDHCIVGAETEDGYQFLDPTAENYRFDYLPDFDQNRDVIIFKGHEPIFGTTPLAKSEESLDFSRRQIRIRPDRSMEVEISSYWKGSKEASFRSFFIHSGPTEIKETLEEVVNEISPGAKLLKYSHSDPLDFKKRFEVTLKYHASDYCKKAGDILIFPEPYIGERCPATGKEKRRYPILYSSRSYSKDEVEFNIPEGYDVYYLPEPVEIENPYFEYRSSYRKKERKVLYQVEFIEKAVKIPAEEYVYYQKFCQMIGKRSERYILFKEKR